jgi:hypothetical protein
VSEVVRTGDREYADGNRLLDGADLGHALRHAGRQKQERRDCDAHDC